MLECFPVITNQRFQIENAILIKVKESPVAESDYHDSRPYLGHLCSSYWLKPSLTEIVSLVWPSPPTTEMTGKIYSQEKNKDSTLMVGFSCVVLKLPAQRGLWLSERVSLLPALVIMVAVNPQPGLHLSLGGEVRSHHNTVHQPLICPAVCRPQLGQVVVEVLTDALCDLPGNETILFPCTAELTKTFTWIPHWWRHSDMLFWLEVWKAAGEVRRSSWEMSVEWTLERTGGTPHWPHWSLTVCVGVSPLRLVRYKNSGELRLGLRARQGFPPCVSAGIGTCTARRSAGR